MSGKVSTLYGIYKKHGRESFLEAAKDYSPCVRDTIEGTLAEMESRWYDGDHTMTEADKMLRDYHDGLTALNEPEQSPAYQALEMKL